MIHPDNEYKEGLAIISQPLFLRCMRILVLLWVVLHTIIIAVLWTAAAFNGKLLVNPLSEAIGVSPLYWAITNSCLAIASVLIMGFVSLCALSFITWVFYLITRRHPTPKARPEAVIKKIAPQYILLGVYGLVFFVCVLVGNIAFIGNGISTATADSTGFLVGVMILTGPIVLAMCVGFVVFVFWFCVALIPCALLSRRMLDYVLRPASLPTKWE